MYIRKEALELILGASREIYPNEFGGMLRGTDDVIEEVLLIPGSIFGDRFASTRFDMVPIDHSIIGSVHSHPSNSFEPSGADLRYFKRLGKIHLIVRKPYGSIVDIAAYDRGGKRISLEPKNR
ncbi:MAG: hypothetical protein A7316_09060 [Candidatus Altiarchaeales archaeon WOR_SM1_86-2]|nr:MAG: hypothetical protein A7316_09060 [Candidatus Altiarchaeales archaeon WOR_SM1_86-2]ODS40321.1 MAG: hypothetical protein A7315_08920 [Candidatus Altiarchaeales archaeon WOR_SM1_79]